MTLLTVVSVAGLAAILVGLSLGERARQHERTTAEQLQDPRATAWTE